jgi:hypothetical protein
LTVIEPQRVTTPNSGDAKVVPRRTTNNPDYNMSGEVKDSVEERGGRGKKALYRVNTLKIIKL